MERRRSKNLSVAGQLYTIRNVREIMAFGGESVFLADVLTSEDVQGFTVCIAAPNESFSFSFKGQSCDGVLTDNFTVV